MSSFPITRRSAVSILTPSQPRRRQRDSGPTLDDLVFRIDGRLEPMVTKAPDLSLAEVAAMRRKRRVAQVDRVPPLSSVMAYDEFEKLVRETVARVPDLRDLWRWQERSSHPDADKVYLLGGALRGLLVWLRENVHKYGAEAVAKMRVPSTLDLLRQPADRDLLALGDIASAVEREIPFLQEPGWEVLRPLDHRNNIWMGGPTIEKVGVGPRRIEDPFGGLRHFWEGKLVFQVGERARSSVQHGHSLLAEALRFLRFVYELDLEPTRESLAILQEIGPSEEGALERSSAAKRLIEKPLEKLLHALREDPLHVVGLIRDANLLGAVSEGSCQLPRNVLDPQKDGHAVRRAVAHLVQARFSARELLQARRIFRLTPEEQVDFSAAIMETTQDPDDVLALLDLTPGVDSGAYAQRLGESVAALCFDGPRWSARKKVRLEHALATLRSPLYFFRDLLTKNEEAAGSSLEVTFGIATPKDQAFAAVRDQQRLTLTERVIAGFPRLPEGEKTELANFLLRIVAEDEEFDPPYGSEEFALSVLTRLGPQDEAVHLALLGQILRATLRRGEIARCLAAMPVGDAVKQGITAAIEASFPEVDDHLAYLAFHFGVGDRLLERSLAHLRSELAKSNPDHREISRAIRPLHAAPAVPEEVVDQLFGLLERHVLSGKTDVDYDWLSGGFTFFLRDRGRRDFELRLNGLVERAWGKDVEMSYFLDCWAGALKHSVHSDVKEAAQALVLDRFAQKGPDQKLIHHWTHFGPSNYPIAD